MKTTKNELYKQLYTLCVHFGLDSVEATDAGKVLVYGLDITNALKPGIHEDNLIEEAHNQIFQQRWIRE